MADEEEAKEGEEGEGEGGGKSKMLMLIIVSVVVAALSIGGTVAVLTMMAPEEPPPSEEGMEGEGGEEAGEAPKAPAIYYPIKPPILVTFDARGRQRYLQAELTLLTREEDVISTLELHMPMIRNALNLLIGSQTYEDIQTAEGKELLRQQCLQELQRLIEGEIGKPGVEQVLFTNIVMQ